MSITETRLKKLPRWAQEYIDEQRRLINYWRERARELPTEHTGIAWSDIGENGHILWSPIPANTTIRFGDAQAFIDVRPQDEALKVLCSHTLAVLPDVTNGVRLVNAPYDWYYKK
jgi:hypothetical protein